MKNKTECLISNEGLAKSISPSGVFRISNNSIEQYMNVFLCDDSENTSYLRIISSEAFKPISFTIGDRLSNSCYLHETENVFDNWCNELILDQLQRISDSEEVRFNNIEKIATVVRDNLQYLLEYDVHGVKL